MNNGKISTRYARALLYSAKEKHSEDKVYIDICLLNKAFFDFPELKHAISSPTITDEDKMKLLTTAVGKDANAETLLFIKFIIQKKREDYMPFIGLMYERLYNEEKRIVLSTVTTAVEIPKETASAITSYISKLRNATVELRTKTDSSIIGGFILDIEDNRMDASIKGQLSKFYKYAGH